MTEPARLLQAKGGIVAEGTTRACLACAGSPRRGRLRVSSSTGVPNELLAGRDWRLVAFASFSLLVLLWDVFLAGQIARARGQRRVVRSLTAICGLFVAPAAAVALAASSMPTARAIHLVAWLWPATLACFVAQSGYALVRGLVTPLVALPIFAFNLALCAAGIARFAGGIFPDLPSALVGAEAAHVAAQGLLFGRMALWSPFLVQLPLLAPAFPARWKVSRTFRALLASVAAVGVVLIVAEYPRSVRAASTFQRFTGERLQQRPDSDFVVGLRVLPPLRGAPPALALRYDLALADTLDAEVLSVVVTPEGTSGSALDSLATALEVARVDPVRLAITLGYGTLDRDAFRRDPSAYAERRLAMIEQIVRRVRPDVLMPALDPFDAGRRALGDVPVEWWQDYLLRASTLAHGLRPRTRVGLAASSFTADDSTLYVWGAATPGIDLVGFSLAPSFGGGASLRARLRVAERWMPLAPTTKEQWIFAMRAFPRTFGEANQGRAVWGTIAWATTQPRIRVVVLDGAADYDAVVGLRAPGGRLRPVVANVGRARRLLEEASR